MPPVSVESPAITDLSEARSAFEQRQFERHPVALTVSVCLVSSSECQEHVNQAALQPPRPACIENLSVSGLCFISTASFPLKSIIGLRLRLGVKTYPLKAMVQRRFVTHLSGKRCFGCGVQFLRTDHALEAIVAIARYLKAIKHPVKDAVSRNRHRLTSRNENEEVARLLLGEAMEARPAINVLDLHFSTDGPE